MKYTYDDLNRLIKVKGLDGDTTKYSYDELGRRVKTDGSKEDTVYTYDEVGNLVSQTTTGAYDLALEYAYDKSGRMTGESRTENGATVESRYVYDALGQLTSFTRSDGYAESYVYDPAGNMTAKTADGVKTNYSYNAANQLVSDGENRYTYDKNGNLVQKGNTRYTYNALNLLESWTNGEYSEEYTYNTAGLLSKITTAESITTLTWDLLYSEGVVLSAVQDGETTDYTYGLERISASTGSSRTEYVYDGRGSVAGEVSYSTAWYTLGGLLSKKNVVAKEYTPFGEQLGEAGSGFGYNGEYYNAAAGMLYLRARFYEPEMNRFSQKDSQYFVLNEYTYCYNNPISFVDINGREAIVVSGGDYDDRREFFKENLNSYNFISPALREIEAIKSNNIDEHVTWIIADSGWSEADKEMFQSAVDGTGVEIVYMTSVEQLTNYINTQSISEKNSGNVSQAREQDKITMMSVFSHGTDNTIPFAFNYLNGGTEQYGALNLTIKEVNKWEKAAFATYPSVTTPRIRLFPCNTVTDEDASIAVAMARQAGATVYGYSGKSNYAGIIADGTTSRDARQYWKDLQNGTLRASFNQPKASDNATAKRVSPNGTITDIKEIPDLNPKPTSNTVSNSNQSSSWSGSLLKSVTNTVKSVANTVKRWLGWKK